MTTLALIALGVARLYSAKTRSRNCRRQGVLAMRIAEDRVGVYSIRLTSTMA